MKPGLTPLDATDEEMCKKVRDLVYSDRRIQVEERAQALGISHGSVSTILHDRLGMRKLTARWVPKFLSDELFLLRFYGPVNPMGSCRAWSVYLTTRLLGRLSPLSG